MLRQRSARSSLSLVALASASAVVGFALSACGSADEPFTIATDEPSACVGDECWDCRDVAIDNGERTVCERTFHAEMFVPRHYECGLEYFRLTCPPPPKPSADAGATDATAPAKPDASSGAAGAPAPVYQCENDGSKLHCESPPSCAPGSHLSPCDECVPDSCASCSCTTPSGGDDDGKKDDGKKDDDNKDKDNHKKDKDKDKDKKDTDKDKDDNAGTDED